ncbi:MAG: hypothetical protein IIZ18_03925 [Ruminococcus sp.]|nr:hypothetical protein [Ruminococcus sp.]
MEIRNNPFYELRSRLYASAAAGCGIIAEDFRLQKAMEAFKPMSEANKVFGKLYAMCQALIKSDDPASEISGCIALADALAVTQGTFETGAEEITPLPECKGVKPKHISYNALNDYCDTIRKAQYAPQKFSSYLVNCISDPRLLLAFVNSAGNDTESLHELFTIFKQVYGENLVPLMKNAFDSTAAKTGGALVKYISETAGTKENEFYAGIARNEEAAPAVRSAAIYALADDPANADLLLEIYQTTKGNIKAAALKALAQTNSPASESALTKKMKTYRDSNLEYIALSGLELCSSYLRKETQYIIENTPKNTNFREHPAIYSIEDALANKKDVKDVFEMLADYHDKNRKLIQSNEVAAINRALISNIILHDDPEYRELLISLYNRVPWLFVQARFFLALMEEPDTACQTYAGVSDEAPAMMLQRLLDIKYTADGWYGIYMYVTNCKEEQRFVKLFRRIPGYMIEFFSKFKKMDKNNANSYQIQVFKCLLDDHAPGDEEAIRKAAGEFAKAGFDAYPDREYIELMLKSGTSVDGLIEDYIIRYVKQNKAAVRSFWLEWLKVTEDILIREIKSAMEKLPTLLEPSYKVVIDAQMKELNRVLKNHNAL